MLNQLLDNLGDDTGNVIISKLGSTNRSCNKIIRLSQYYNSLDMNEVTELLRGTIYVFDEVSQKKDQEDITPHDIHNGIKKVLASLSGQCIMGYPVKFDARTLRNED